MGNIKETKDIIMKNPITSIAAILAFFAPFQIALFVFKTQIAISLGITGIIGIGAIIASIQIISLWGISWCSLKLAENFMIEIKPHNNWQTNIIAGSLLSLIFNIISLIICFFYNKTFKDFVFLSYSIFIVRTLILIIDYFMVKYIPKV